MKTISKSSTWAKLLYEFIGTAIMVYAFNSVGAVPTDQKGFYVRARPFAYMIMWIIAYKVSGAHFNPATSLAVVITERKTENIIGFFLTILAQFVGAYLGIGLSFLLIKDYLQNYFMQPALTAMYFDILTLDPYWGRPIL